jgi:hypothetical protein
MEEQNREACRPADRMTVLLLCERTFSLKKRTVAIRSGAAYFVIALSHKRIDKPFRYCGGGMRSSTRRRKKTDGGKVVDRKTRRPTTTTTARSATWAWRCAMPRFDRSSVCIGGRALKFRIYEPVGRTTKASGLFIVSSS